MDTDPLMNTLLLCPVRTSQCRSLRSNVSCTRGSPGIYALFPERHQLTKAAPSDLLTCRDNFVQRELSVAVYLFEGGWNRLVDRYHGVVGAVKARKLQGGR